MATPLRHLGLVEEVVHQIGLDVIDQYEDLIFVSQNQFILKFADQDRCVDLYFNEDIDEARAQALMALMEGVAEAEGLRVSYKGAFCLAVKEDSQIKIEFFNLLET